VGHALPGGCALAAVPRGGAIAFLGASARPLATSPLRVYEIPTVNWLDSGDSPEKCSVPTYTYTCTACNDLIEKRQSFSDPPLTTCEQCGGALRKVIHPVGIVFKGSGW
jgi:putative FmdB family regulatory protein